METRKITTPRGEFNVREGGNKDGFPVVMLHGWPESSYCWEGVAAHLDPGFRLIAPDLRGLGDSERTMDMKAYQKAELAKDMAGLLDAIGIGDRLHRVGREGQAAVAAVARDQAVESRFVDRHLSPPERRDTVFVDIDADNGIPHFGEAGARDQADVACSNDCQFHGYQS